MDEYDIMTNYIDIILTNILLPLGLVTHDIIIYHIPTISNTLLTTCGNVLVNLKHSLFIFNTKRKEDINVNPRGLFPSTLWIINNEVFNFSRDTLVFSLNTKVNPQGFQ